MAKYLFGIYVPDSRFSRYIYRSLDDLKNWLSLFDVVENSNDRIVCRWTYCSDHAFGLSTVFLVGKMEFRFNQYPIYANSIEKMDNFLNLLDQKIATIALIGTTNPDKKAKREIRKALEKIIKEIALNLEREEVKKKP
ncbi:MAG: hypothetical protein QXI58_01185 [Candidatus Micrarchaeia archaeon]